MPRAPRNLDPALLHEALFMATGIRIEHEVWKANFSGVNRVYIQLTLVSSSSFGFSRQGSPLRIFHLHLVLSCAPSFVTSATAMPLSRRIHIYLFRPPRFLFPGCSILSIFPLNTVKPVPTQDGCVDRGCEKGRTWINDVCR